MRSFLDLILTTADRCSTNATRAKWPETPQVHDIPQIYAVTTHRPRLESVIRQLEQWSTCEEWVDVDGEAAMLDRILFDKYLICFPKPHAWESAVDNREYSHGIEDQRRAWDGGRMDQWRHLHIEMRMEIKKTKKSAAQKIEHDVNSTKFAKDSKSVLGCEEKTNEIFIVQATSVNTKYVNL